MKVEILESYKNASEVLNEDVEEAGDLVVDADAPIKDIAAEVTAAAEEGGDDASIAPADAVKTAADAKATAQQVGAENIVVEPAKGHKVPYLKFENALTKQLDRCTKAAKRGLAKQARGRENGVDIPLNDSNLLVIGSPGCAKTAVVRNWANARNMNLFSINMRDNELYAFINGYPCKEDENGKTIIKQAYSANLRQMETGEKNTVLFLDEFNRQTNDTIRQTVMEVVKERAVSGDDEKAKNNLGKHIFEDMLFTVAVMNPPDKSDKGLADLADAEKDRFPVFMALKSNVEDTRNYIKSVTINDLESTRKDHIKKYKDPILGDLGKESVYVKEVYKSLLKYHLVDSILVDSAFKFDDDYDYLENEPIGADKHIPDLSNPLDRTAVASAKMAKAMADRKKRVEEIRGLVSQRTITNLFMNDGLLFDFGEEPLSDFIEVILRKADISTEKQYMLAALIQDYIEVNRLGSGNNSSIGPSMTTLIAEGGKELLELAGYSQAEINEIKAYAKAHPVGSNEEEELEDVDADFEKDLADAGDDLEKISQIGVERAKNAPPVQNGIAAGDAQAIQGAAASIDWD